MLQPHTIQTVKSTAPVLQEHGETLTRHFYERMFKCNPEVAPLFNTSNQSTGNQQRALAGAIAAYAANIDNLDALSAAVDLITQKHVSLQIKPEHYPIVGENLLCSIKEVLGDKATTEVLSAWAEAYNFLAKILIDKEEQIYKKNANQPGGWEGFRLFHIARKEKESSNITSFYLIPTENKQPLPMFKPGQYLTVRVRLPNGLTTMRNYSLSDKPGQPYFRISVKREIAYEVEKPNGYVSNLMHDHINIGDTIEVAAPCGDFYLEADDTNKRPLALFGAGVGITPIMSMLLTALEKTPNREIIFIHASQNETVQAFKSDLDELSKQYKNLTLHYCYSDSNINTSKNNSSIGFLTPEIIKKTLPDINADYYFCGPKPFMIKLYKDLLNFKIPKQQIKFEFFGPRQELHNLG